MEVEIQWDQDWIIFDQKREFQRGQHIWFDMLKNPRTNIYSKTEKKTENWLRRVLL